MEGRQDTPLSRRLPPLALFVLAPLIGEFLLGNLPVTWLWVLPFLALLYGAGALLIREVALRFRAGWRGIFLLGIAFGIIEEGFVTQSLFDPDYLGLRLLDYGFIPELGIGAWWTIFVISIHTIWSTAAAIALVEALWPARARGQWLGPVGLGFTLLLFIGGCVLLASFEQPRFQASSGQQLLSAVAVVLLVAAAWLVGRRGPRKESDRAAPSPQTIGVIVFIISSLFMMSTWTIELIPAPANVAVMLSLIGTAWILLGRWSRSSGWTRMHVFAVAAGAIATYGWWGIVQVPSIAGASATVDLAGNLGFVAGALALLFLARHRVKVAAEWG